jgi:hypothetical protein
MWLISALGVLLASGTPTANATRVWLVVGASDKSPAAIAMKANGLIDRFPGGLVFAAVDCGDKANVLGFAADIASEPVAAEAALVQVRRKLADAYLKRCDVKPGSLLGHRIHAVDPSIARVPSTAVNWGDEDRVSTVFNLNDGRAIAAVRYFEKAPEDPLEGKRTRLQLLSGASSVTLTQNCLLPTRLSARKNLIAVQCVVEQAADNLLHDVLVFDSVGRRLLTVSRCAEPRWVSDTILQCKEESVDANGELKVSTKRVSVASSP